MQCEIFSTNLPCSLSLRSALELDNVVSNSLKELYHVTLQESVGKCPLIHPLWYLKVLFFCTNGSEDIADSIWNHIHHFHRTVSDDTCYKAVALSTARRRTPGCHQLRFRS